MCSPDIDRKQTKKRRQLKHYIPTTDQHSNPLLPLTKHKRGAGFTFVKGRRRTANDHRGSRISTQTFLEYAGQLAVSIRNVILK